MAIPNHTGTASACADESTENKLTASASVPGQGAAVAAPVPDLEAAAIEAGNHPERAAALAADLGIGTQRECVLHQALRGVALPPPIFDNWYDPPHPGAFDAGVARVLAHEYVVDFAEWVRGNKYPIVDSTPDVVSDLREEVSKSYGFARYALMLTADIRLALSEQDSEEELQTQAASDLSTLGAVGFYAGWLMALEHAEAKRSHRTSTEKVAELIDLFRRKVHLGAVDDQALMSAGTRGSESYWTPEQIEVARWTVRMEETPEEHPAITQRMKEGMPLMDAVRAVSAEGGAR